MKETKDSKVIRIHIHIHIHIVDRGFDLATCRYRSTSQQKSKGWGGAAKSSDEQTKPYVFIQLK